MEGYAARSESRGGIISAHLKVCYTAPHQRNTIQPPLNLEPSQRSHHPESSNPERLHMASEERVPLLNMVVSLGALNRYSYMLPSTHQRANRIFPSAYPSHPNAEREDIQTPN